MFPNYIVEGQDNGRLNTKTYGTKSYNPNTIDEEKRISLINPYEDEAFVYFDYQIQISYKKHSYFLFYFYFFSY